MSVAQGIRKFGFRHWYERQLIEAHACLVTAFLGVIMVAVCLDQFRWRDAGVKPALMLGLVIAGIVLCAKMVRVYYRVLFRAECYARQSVCGQCKVYGVLQVVSASTHEPQYADSAADRNWLRVRCRKCGHDWVMSERNMDGEA